MCKWKNITNFYIIKGQISFTIRKLRCASDFALDNVRICIFCNVSHLMNKIVYTFFVICESN